MLAKYVMQSILKQTGSLVTLEVRSPSDEAMAELENSLRALRQKKHIVHFNRSMQPDNSWLLVTQIQLNEPCNGEQQVLLDALGRSELKLKLMTT